MKEKKSFIVSHILPLFLHIFSLGIFVKPINHAFLPDCGAFLSLRPSGVPTHSAADLSHGGLFDRESTRVFGFLRFYLDIRNTESTMELYAVTGNKGSRQRIPWATVRYLAFMLIARSPGCPNHVFSFKNLEPLYNKSRLFCFLHESLKIHWNYFSLIFQKVDLSFCYKIYIFGNSW